ncbi:hypothetical protein NE452_17400, partial [Paeniclostridium sordellii]|nr:hypothetical protein [Paeniclostridium sordellii]
MEGTSKEESNIPVINNITTNLEVTVNQKNSLTYLMDNVERIKALLDGTGGYYKDITESNIEAKEDIVKYIYNFKLVKIDYRAKTLKLDT